MDDNIKCNLLKFTDDTKVFRKGNIDGDKQHTGHGNLDINYNMGCTVLSSTVRKKDLGITISADIKVSEPCGIAASKGNQILRLIRRIITCKKKAYYTSV